MADKVPHGHRAGTYERGGAVCQQFFASCPIGSAHRGHYDRLIIRDSWPIVPTPWSVPSGTKHAYLIAYQYAGGALECPPGPHRSSLSFMTIAHQWAGEE